ncbi:hypothetical protein OEZ85_000815 [Tetradesmus obliquus]|uniref:Heme peroxidase n=1 Tax=Tetradesmus obliquus TaxID=3088 RepID=A0ABY8UKR2_TETOB|nr:hypothetical protein OEZ85_000815 [Tetradesmus obliquus]
MLLYVVYRALQPFWLKLWPPLQVVYLISKRVILRERNLAAPTLPPSSAIRENGTPLDARTFEGSLNNQQRPTMAMTGCPFIRNTPAAEGNMMKPLDGPDPVLVAQKILARPGGVTKTRPLVNLLGGAWIQFMLHDWFELRKDKKAAPVTFPLPGGSVMPLQPAVLNREGSVINNHDHWWSGCQIYGTTPDKNHELRSGVDGKLRLVNNGPVTSDGTYLPLDAAGTELVGFNLNLWTGLQLLHFVFAKEHNTVCDMLRANNPTWDDAKLFAAARLIITALLARIHTVEWTTAIIQHPAGRASQYFLWYGILGTLFGRKLHTLTKLLRRLPTFIGQFLCGIPGSNTVMAGDNLPFAHSEEFIAVYRMHSLLPDSVELRASSSGKLIKTVGLGDIILDKGTAVNTSVPLPDLFYTLGVGHAGALELRNFPTALRSLETPALKAKNAEQPKPHKLLDMAAVDVWRGRESRLPLFNAYLKALSLPTYSSFDKLGIEDAGARAALKEVYGNDIDKIDVAVGLLAETPLPGWIFGEAVYTIFVLQTQRRLESDRFYTADFDEAAYTAAGLDYVHDTTMSDILMRHVPELALHLQPRSNAFIPWGSSNKRQLHEAVIWDLLLPGTVLGWLRDMGYSW